MGLVKNEPALRLSGSPASSTMPLRARTLSTADRASPSGTWSPGATPSSAARDGERTGADRGRTAAIRPPVAVPDPDRDDRVGHFLAVGADVLDRGRAAQAGDAGQ